VIGIAPISPHLIGAILILDYLARYNNEQHNVNNNPLRLFFIVPLVRTIGLTKGLPDAKDIRCRTA